MEKIMKQINDEVTIHNKEISNLERKYKIKNSKYINKLKSFYQTRNEMVCISRLRSQEEAKKYHKKLIKIEDDNFNEIIYERDIDEEIYLNLMRRNFELVEPGVIYLKKLIRIIYDEKEFQETVKTDEFGYWDLEDYNNIHYKFLSNYNKNYIYEIIKSISKNKKTKDMKITEIVNETIEEITRELDFMSKIKKRNN